MDLSFDALVIDDNAQDRFLVVRELRKQFPGCRPAEVADRAQFDEALGGRFELVITDYQLRWGDGLEVLRAIKARRPDCPVIMFTATGNQEIAVEAMKEGLDDYIVKSPKHLVRLTTSVRLALERAEGRRRAVRLEEELRIKAEALAEANRRKDEFLAILAHELRNPMAPIRNALHILEQPNLPPEAAAAARQMMGRQIRNLTRLVDDLLDVSRIARGQVELRKETLDLAAVVSRSLEAVRPRLEERGLGLGLALPPHPVRVEADPVRLEQIFANLLDNAAKFTDAGGRIGVMVETDGGEAVVRIADTGVGIPPERLGDIFEPFTHVDRSRSGPSQWGLGIGLTLVRSLAALHGGRVEAISDGPGTGSEFAIRLPMLRNEPRPGGLSPAADEPIAGGPLRVLVVDDSRDSADSLAMLLRLAGHVVHTAYGGADALEAAPRFRPRLALLDIGMPGIDGYDLARRLRQQPGAGDLVLAALTGWGQDEDRARSREAGFQHHLVKPVDPEALAKLVALIEAE